MAKILINDQTSARGFECAEELTRHGHKIVTTNDPALLMEVIKKIAVDLVVVCADGSQNSGLVQTLKGIAPDTPILIYPRHDVIPNSSEGSESSQEERGGIPVLNAAGVG